jgi:hypothetical protein
MKSDNISAIKSATDNLNAVWHQAAGQIYQKTNPAQTQSEPEAAGKSSASGRDNAVDADFEVVK